MESKASYSVGDRSDEEGSYTSTDDSSRRSASDASRESDPSERGAAAAVAGHAPPSGNPLNLAWDRARRRKARKRRERARMRRGADCGTGGNGGSVDGDGSAAEDDGDVERSVSSQVLSRASNAEGFMADEASCSTNESRGGQWTSAGRSAAEDENEMGRSVSSRATSRASSASGFMRDEASVASYDTEDSHDDQWPSAGRSATEEDRMALSVSSRATSRASSAEGFSGDEASVVSYDTEGSHDEQGPSAGRSAAEDDDRRGRSVSSRSTSRASSAASFTGDDASATSYDWEESHGEHVSRRERRR